MMKKLLTGLAGILLLGSILTLGGCGWGPRHGHGRGWHGHNPGNNWPVRYWHGPQYGYSHDDGGGHYRY